MSLKREGEGLENTESHKAENSLVTSTPWRTAVPFGFRALRSPDASAFLPPRIVVSVPSRPDWHTISRRSPSRSGGAQLPSVSQPALSAFGLGGQPLPRSCLQPTWSSGVSLAHWAGSVQRDAHALAPDRWPGQDAADPVPPMWVAYGLGGCPPVCSGSRLGSALRTH